MEEFDKTHKGFINKQIKQTLKDTKIPTLPMVARKLVNLCMDDMASFADFADIIRLDPGLGIQFLRIANSAYYGQLEPVSSIQKCIQILGLKYVKSIALGFHLASTLNKYSGKNPNTELFWHQSVLRGVIARQMAQHYIPSRSEEAFLIGLLLDCGIIMLAKSLGDRYIQIWMDSLDSPHRLFKTEQLSFDYDHIQASAIVMEQWFLPAILAQPIQLHHTRTIPASTTNEVKQLAQIAYFTGNLSLFKSDSITEDIMDLQTYGQSIFGFDQQQLTDILDESQKEFSSISQLFRDILPETMNTEELLMQAKNILSDLTIEAHQKVSDLETEVVRLHNSCQTLTGSLEMVLEEVETDNLTGLVRRGFLERFLETACQWIQKRQMDLTVFFLDIDNFKTINSQYGHKTGDLVLQILAETLKNCFPPKSCLSRYGGDEMVAAVCNIGFKESLSQAERLLQTIRKLAIPIEVIGRKEDIAFTCSIGMLFCESGSKPGCAGRILELADHQMYQVKNKGKNSHSYQILSAQSAATTSHMPTNK